METVKEIQARHQKEVNKFEGMFFAFSNNQLAEGLEKVGLAKDAYSEIVSLGAGGYLRKDRKQAFHEMFERHAAERKEARRLMKTIKIEFKGIDSWNRPVFKSLEKPYRYYGSVNALFDDDATEEKVLSELDEDGLVYFGDHFGCEPMGSNSGNIEIVSKSTVKV